MVRLQLCATLKPAIYFGAGFLSYCMTLHLMRQGLLGASGYSP